MSEGKTNLVALALRARHELRAVLRSLEPEETGWPLAEAPRLCRSLPALDALLALERAGGGLAVEVWATQEAELWRLAANCAGAAPRPEACTLIADPFDEAERPGFRAEGLRLRLKDPFLLMQALLRALEEGRAGLLVLPPGLIEQRFLSSEPGAASGASGEAHFQTAFAALLWSARRAGALVLVLREVSRAERTRPLSCQARVRLERKNGRRRYRLEHHGFEPGRNGTEVEEGVAVA